MTLKERISYKALPARGVGKSPSTPEKERNGKGGHQRQDDLLEKKRKVIVSFSLHIAKEEDHIFPSREEKKGEKEARYVGGKRKSTKVKS